MTAEPFKTSCKTYIKMDLKLRVQWREEEVVSITHFSACLSAPVSRDLFGENRSRFVSVDHSNAIGHSQSQNRQRNWAEVLAWSPS